MSKKFDFLKNSTTMPVGSGGGPLFTLPMHGHHDHDHDEHGNCIHHDHGHHRHGHDHGDHDHDEHGNCVPKKGK
jgi:hypothetical protein